MKVKMFRSIHASSKTLSKIGLWYKCYKHITNRINMNCLLSTHSFSIWKNLAEHWTHPPEVQTVDDEEWLADRADGYMPYMVLPGQQGITWTRKYLLRFWWESKGQQRVPKDETGTSTSMCYRNIHNNVQLLLLWCGFNEIRCSGERERERDRERETKMYLCWWNIRTIQKTAVWERCLKRQSVEECVSIWSEYQTPLSLFSLFLFLIKNISFSNKRTGLTIGPAVWGTASQC